MLPIKDRSCFSDLGGIKLSIASVFVILGTKPDGDSLYPSQFTSDWKNSHLGVFNAKLLSFSFFRTSKTNFSCYFSSPFETIKISSKKQMHSERDPWLFETPLACSPDHRSLEETCTFRLLVPPQ